MILKDMKYTRINIELFSCAIVLLIKNQLLSLPKMMKSFKFLREKIKKCNSILKLIVSSARHRSASMM